jgi:hypothetical protein
VGAAERAPATVAAGDCTSSRTLVEIYCRNELLTAAHDWIGRSVRPLHWQWLDRIVPRPLQERTSCVCLHTCRRVACTSTLWSQARPGGGGAHSRRMHEARVHRRLPMPADSRRSSSMAAHVRRRARESTLINIETDEDDGAARSCLRAASLAHILSQLHVRLSLCPSAILSQRVGGRAVAAECGTERLCSRDREIARGSECESTGRREALTLQCACAYSKAVERCRR